jgi:hypothetical protein
MAAWNENPKPFVWTATVESIGEKLSHCGKLWNRYGPGCTLTPTAPTETLSWPVIYRTVPSNIESM